MLICITALLFNGCKKGDKGEVGPAGTNGNANVQGYTFSVPLASFIGPLTNNGWEYIFNITTVMGSGSYIGANDAILMYLFDQTAAGTDYYNALPYLDYFNAGTAYNQHSFQIGATGSTNLILIDIRNSTGGQPYTSMTTGSLYYKIVWVQSRSKQKPILPSDLSYPSVKAFYNLKD